MSKNDKNKNKERKNYKKLTAIWRAEDSVNDVGIEQYPDWANNYHSIYDLPSGRLTVNPDVAESMSIDDVMWDEMNSWDNLQKLAINAPSGQEILNAGIDIINMLLEKNISYGNSAISPLRLFSDASTEEQIYVRLDDKLSRLKNNQSYPGDNDIDDLIGYLILLKVARRINA